MLRPGHILALAALALLTAGMVMVTSAELKGVLIAPEDTYTVRDALAQVLRSRDVLYYALALTTLAAAAAVPWHALRHRLPPWMRGERRADRLAALGVGTLLVLAALATVYVPGLAQPRNGAHRWVGAAGFSFQPSEIAKWAFVLLLAWYAASAGPDLRRLRVGLLPPALATGLVTLLIGKEDLGTAALLAAVAAFILIAGGARLVDFFFLAPAGLALAFAGIWFSPYRVQRLTAFLDPYADPQGTGYHIIQSMLAIASGGFWGRGLGFGVQKLGYLPEGESDFLFAIVAEELGLPGVTALLILLSALVWSGCAVARRQTDPLLKLVALGVTATVAFQATINLFVVAGMAPTKGIALPLVSHGGTGWVMTALCIGVVVSIDRAAASRSPTPVHDDADRNDAEITVLATEAADLAAPDRSSPALP